MAEATEIGRRASGGRQLRKVRKTVQFTPKRRALFLENVASTCNLTLSAKRAGVSLSTVCRWRRNDADFAAEVKAAIRAAYDLLEPAVIDRSLNGMKKPVFYAGKKIGEAIEYDQRTAMQLMRLHHDVANEAPVTEGSSQDRHMQAIWTAFAEMAERGGVEWPDAPSPPEKDPAASEDK